MYLWLWGKEGREIVSAHWREFTARYAHLSGHGLILSQQGLMVEGARYIWPLRKLLFILTIMLLNNLCDWTPGTHINMCYDTQ